jgi:hypothetical protein
MNKKEMIKIINEEISNFDYLGMDIQQKEVNKKELVNSKEFIVKLINDILEENTENFKFKEVVGTKKEVDDLHNMFNVGNSDLFYEIHFFYDFMGVDYEFTILLEGNNITTEPTINWGEIDTTLVFDEIGEEVDIDWLKKNDKIYEKFIKSLIYGDFEE